MLFIIGQHNNTNECHVSLEDFKAKTSFEDEAGKNITLPCLPTFKINEVEDSLEWFKGNDRIVFIKLKTVNFVHEKYKDRINQSALLEELSKGTASLNLHKVNLSDAGNYCCCIHHMKLSCIGLTLGKNFKPLTFNLFNKMITIY